ncbi:two-component response regulator-like APRR1 [Olea europaea subsp. europaea]|uniref:Two-component response regulator-like APRR1 n=1 Tax=Olea europaea subsp. europaea TaxID=158383 RepID=A0A8S0QX01_OLEEU|nr:two-component response regulator-like APRR1 [Olea europaea subsp. europaea]
MEKSEIGKNGDGFIDRSKVRILVCDNDTKSSKEVLMLLCKCSYQVTSVRSPRQVIDALNAEGPDIDIILSEVDLPMSKGLKMLKHITRDKDLQRIPVIMMSAQDEVSIVVKCLKFGAADYLVKPLRTNELLNLWTHMWRRRRMLGLAEKNIVNYDFDMVVSDPSDANTNSTTLFSDDTDDKSRKSIHPEACVSTHQEDESNATAAAATPTGASTECQPDVPGISDQQTGKISPFQKKSELKIGESSAFFTYIKSSMPRSNNQGDASVRENVPQNLRIKEKLTTMNGQVGADIQGHDNRDSVENHSQGDDNPSSNSIPDSLSMERSCTPPISLETSQPRNSNEEFSQMHMHPRNESPNDGVGFHANPAYSYYMSGVMNQFMMSSAAVYQKNPQPQDLRYHTNSAILPQYNHNPHYAHHVPGMASYPYYPVGICLPTGQMPTSTHAWSSQGSASANEGKLSNIDRREAALMKFKQKRKERCFDKRIRYVNRKRLAERRPRVKGQFVRKVNGVNVDLNGLPASAEDDDEEEEDCEEDQTANMDSSPEGDASICH